jgi:hypothetical protein
MRTPEERRLRRWTEPERQAIAVEIACGRVVVVPRGRSGRTEDEPNLWPGPSFAFIMAMRRLKEAA